MPRPSHLSLLAALTFCIAAVDIAHAQPIDRANPLVLAQAPPSEQEKERAKRKEMEHQKGPAGEPKKAPGGNAPPAGKSVLTPPDKGPPPGRDRRVPSADPSGPPPAGKGVEPSMRKANEQPFERKKGPDVQEPRKQVIPGQPPPTGPKGPVQNVTPLPKGPAPSLPSQAGPPPGPAGAAPLKRVAPGPGPAGPAGAGPRFGDVQKARKERVEEGGRRVIEEPGNRIIVKQGDRIVIRHDEAERFRRGGRDVKSERRPDGRTETFYVRPDGMRIVSVTDGNGRLLRRYRRGPDGREFNLIDNRKFYGTAVVVGVSAVGLAVALNLARPRVMIPREQYIVDYDRASDDDLYEALMAPPVEDLERAYSLEEVRDNYLLRDRMRRVDLDSINFEFGAWEVTPDQYGKLERVARAMMRVLSRNPDEVFLVEGHTDAVGNDVDNLSLSDRRAEAVAGILSDTFGIPPENLITQGYGKQFLKVDTPAAERVNRRVAIRRITPLMSER
jgi:outer membrane protein OmpA-like peptidoglycan-associated protein